MKKSSLLFFLYGQNGLFVYLPLILSQLNQPFGRPTNPHYGFWLSLYHGVYSGECPLSPLHPSVFLNSLEILIA